MEILEEKTKDFKEHSKEYYNLSKQLVDSEQLKNAIQCVKQFEDPKAVNAYKIYNNKTLHGFSDQVSKGEGPISIYNLILAFACDDLIANHSHHINDLLGIDKIIHAEDY